jgi:putative transposase
VPGPPCLTTFRPKARSGITSINGVAPDSGSGSMTLCALGCGRRPASRRSPAPAASIARPSRRPAPAGNGATTRGKKINGVKRHTLGLPLAVVVHPANIQDPDGAKLVFAKAQLSGPWPRMGRVWADGGYAGKLVSWVASFCQWVLEIVKRNDDVKGFMLLPKRWVVERTFSWLSNYRRLSKHYEYSNDTAETMIHLAMIRLMLRRLAEEEPKTVVS